MRRGSLLLALALVGCGGSHHSGGGETSTAVLRMTRSAGASLGGLDANGNPQIAYRTDLQPVLRVLGLTGERKVTVDTTALVSPTALASDYVLTVVQEGNLVFDLRTGASRTVTGVTPLGTDGDRVLWESDDGTHALSVEDLDTGVRTAVPIALGPVDAIRDFRDGRLLVERGTLTPVEGGGRLDLTYQTVALDGTVLSTLRVPDGVYGARPTGMNAAGEVVGTATRPGAIPLVDSRPYVLKWSATGEPTFLDTSVSSAAVGLADDGSAVAWPVDMEAGTLRLLRNGTSTPLPITVGHPWAAQVRGRFVFVQDLRDYRVSVYALP